MSGFHFYKMNPGGNTTLFILDPVSPALRAPIARQLLRADHLQAEQVGFLRLDTNPVHLDMMGGEFCGNACRAAVAVMAREGTGLQQEKNILRGQIAVSGVRGQLEVYMEKAGGVCWAQMPLSSGPNVSRPGPGLHLVRLPGITHLCLDEALHPFPDDYVQAALDWRRQLDLQDLAVGCIWYRFDKLSIKPVVWVQGTNSTYYESACGSGSLALALGTGCENGCLVLQPSGARIGVKLERATGKAWIYGQVAPIARGEVFVDLPRADI